MVGLSKYASVPNMKLSVTIAFRDWFTSCYSIHVERWEARFPCLDHEEADPLKVPFSEEDIRHEMISVDGNKALGPNGIPFNFALMFWPDIKGELLSLFNHFFETAEFNHRVSFSFIALIPKVESPTNINDFRPILLLRWVHKLVSRMLTVILKRVIGILVQDSQSAFIQVRNIFKG